VKPYVVKLGDYWTWGCFGCDFRLRELTWRGAVSQALQHVDTTMHHWAGVS
jgi:hypothetical protein